jgi:hypothetical protein
MKLRAALLSAVTVLAAACSTMTVNVDWDRSLDFSRYRTFAFQKGSPARRDFTQKRIEDAVAAKLQSRGFALAAAGRPDLRVVTHVIVSRAQRIDYTTYGWGWRWRGGPTVATVTNIPIGTLVVDLVDTEQKEVVWRGQARDTIGSDPEERAEKLQEAVNRLFENFPPPPGH